MPFPDERPRRLSESSRVEAAKPCAAACSVKLVSCSGQVSLGSATKVPQPCLRTSRPSATRSASARRTVVREVASSMVSTRSVGTG